MKTCRWIVLALVACAAPLVAQDEKAIQEKVDKALDAEVARLEKDLADLARGELTVKGPAAPKDAVGKALALVTEDLLRKHATYLASDELEGRNAGYPGNDKATEYIRDVMKAAGLKPVGDQDTAGNPTFWQHFKVAGRQTRNCLGLLEGTDPDLKKEIVVLGAHHDHVGTKDQSHWGRLGGATEDDGIWNGADDNGSGTTTVLALIKALGEGGLRTKRSILFMTFSGEEAGLNGSRFYTNHPIAPIEQHVYMLNLDMVGRNADRNVGIHGVGSAEDGIVRRAVEAAVGKTGLKADIHDHVAFMGGDSDHSSFRDKGVPYTFFFTGLHADYHRVSDHPDKLAYPNMVKIARTAAHTLLAVADGEKSPRFKGFRMPDPGTDRPRRMLGVTPGDALTEEDYKRLGLGEDQGAVLIERVTAGSVADKAGLKAGDYILSLGGRKFGRKGNDLRASIDKVEPGKEVPVEILRGEERMTLKAVWEK